MNAYQATLLAVKLYGTIAHAPAPLGGGRVREDLLDQVTYIEDWLFELEHAPPGRERHLRLRAQQGCREARGQLQVLVQATCFGEPRLRDALATLDRLAPFVLQAATGQACN